MTPPLDLTGFLAELLLLGEHPSMVAVEARLRVLAWMVGPTDGLTRQAVRSATIDTLTTMKVRGAAALVDAALGLVRATTHGGQGRAIEFEEIEPWPAPVDGAGLLDDVVSLMKRFVVMSEVVADALVLLIVNAHVHDASNVSPIAVLTSATKQCGKTVCLRFVLVLVPRPLATSNISSAALFRTVEASTPTLVIDEADTFLKLSEEMRGLLNAGHTRDLAYVIRNVGEDHEPRKFTTWCPKFVALIGRLPDTIESRSVVLPLLRAKKTDPLEKVQKRRPKQLVETLPARLARWAADHRDKLHAHDAAIPESLNDREGDNWSPLLAIADLAGGDWPERARKAALALSGHVDPEQEEAGEAALHATGALLAAAPGKRMASATVVARLTADPTDWWAAFRDEKPITQRQLARLLGRFGIKPKELRLPEGVLRGYDLEDFKDVLLRYPPPGSATSATSASDNANRDESIRNTQAAVSNPKSGVDPHKQRGVADVADPQGGSRGGQVDGTDPDDPRGDLDAPDEVLF